MNNQSPIAPAERPSDEADLSQLDMARREGDAYQRSLTYMAKVVADSGASKRAGDYIVSYAQERAEGMYRRGDDGDLQWVEPTDENCHLEISVSDAGDGRFIPYLNVTATLTAADGRKIGPFDMPFLWHPGLYHYGRNIEVPGDGRYMLDVHIPAPDFMRHDRTNGRRYAHSINIRFSDVPIKTGRE